jgi:hypothetical protein
VGHVVVVSLFWVPLNSISSIVCWKNQPRFNSINICMSHQGRTGCSQIKCYVHCEVFGSALRLWTLKHFWCTSAKLSQTRCNYWITHLDACFCLLMTPRGGRLCTESFGGIKEREVVNKDSKNWTRDDQSNQKRREELKERERERERERREWYGYKRKMNWRHMYQDNNYKHTCRVKARGQGHLLKKGFCMRRQLNKHLLLVMSLSEGLTHVQTC